LCNSREKRPLPELFAVTSPETRSLWALDALKTGIGADHGDFLLETRATIGDTKGKKAKKPTGRLQA
jgi:hypothetical protein